MDTIKNYFLLKYSNKIYIEGRPHIIGLTSPYSFKIRVFNYFMDMFFYFNISGLDVHTDLGYTKCYNFILSLCSGGKFVTEQKDYFKINLGIIKFLIHNAEYPHYVTDVKGLRIVFSLAKVDVNKLVANSNPHPNSKQWINLSK